MSISDLRLLVERTDSLERGRVPQPTTLYLSATVKKTLDVIMKLKEPGSPVDFHANVNALKEMVVQDDSLICMEDYQPHIFIIDFLLHHSNDKPLEADSCDLFLRLSKRSVKLRKSIQGDIKLVKLIIHICEQVIISYMLPSSAPQNSPSSFDTPSSPSLTSQSFQINHVVPMSPRTIEEVYDVHLDTCMALIAAFLVHGPHAGLVARSHVLEEFLRQGLVATATTITDPFIACPRPVLTSALAIPSLSSLSPALIVNASKILASLPVREHRLAQFLEASADKLAIILTAYVNSRTVIVNVSSFIDTVINSSSGSDRVITALIENYLPSRLMNAIIADHGSDSSSHLAALLSLLSSLLRHCKPYPLVDLFRFQDALQNATMKFTDDLAVETFGIKVLYYLLGYLSLQNLVQKLDESWLQVIYKAMMRYRTSTLLNEWACKSLVILFLLRPDLLKFVGDESSENQDNLHTCLLGVLLMDTLRDSIGVICSGCDALSAITTQSSRLQGTLSLKNAHLGVWSAMTQHCNSVFVQRAGCRAIRSLGIFSRYNQREIYRDDVLDRITDIFERFANNEEVLTEAIITLTCIADLDEVKHQIVLQISSLQSVFNFPQMMNRYLSAQKLQIACFECICVLASAEGATCVMCSVGILEVCLNVAEQHASCYSIQKYILILIQLLTNDIEIDDLDLVNKVADCIKSAMRAFPDSLSIQTEGCVAAQLLVEKHPRFGPIFLDKRMYECAFEILEKYPERADLFNLAAEFVYIIVCERRLKSRILMEAIVQGQVKVVECLLELGSSPNMMTGNESPLSAAVQSNTERVALKIVRSLLDKGANELLTPLEMSIRKNYSRISGLLLKEIGFHKQNESLTWCNLNLVTFRIEWLEELIATKDNGDDVFRAKMRRLARKILHCQEIRTDRLLAHDFVCSKKLPLRYPLVQRAPHKASIREISPVEGYRGEQVEQNERLFTGRWAGASGSRRQVLSKERASPGGQMSKEVGDAPVRESKYSRKSVQHLPISFSYPKSERVTSGSGPKITSERFVGRRVTLHSNISSRAKYLSDGDIAEEVAAPETSNEDTRVLYLAIAGEVEDFYQTSLSGANIPFSLKDPRRGGNGPTEEMDIRLDQAHVTKLGEFSMARRSLAAYLENTAIKVNSDITEYIKLTPSNINDDELSEESQHSDGAFSTTSELTDSYGGKSEDRGRITKPQRSVSTLPRTPISAPGSCSSPNLRQLPQIILRTVDLSSNALDSVSQLVLIRQSQSLTVCFSHVTRINLAHNRLRSIPPDLWNLLPRVTHVHLNDNKIEKFPYNLLVCCPLERLDISNNQITEIVLKEVDLDHISRVAFSLKTLSISGNGLTEFPISLISNLYGLEEITLQGNKLRELPATSFRLKRLKYLNLANNYIKIVPEEFLAEFPNLVSLDLTCNELESLPTGNVVDHLCQLATLKLAHNVLAAKKPFYIPQFVLKLPALRYLDLSNNQLSGIASPEKWSTRNLKELILSNNQIQTLIIANAKEHWGGVLERLALSHNKLTKLPPEIGRLSQLTSLDVSYNPLTSLPDELGLLVGRLWDFPTDGLKVNLDEALLKGPRKNLLGYLHNRLKKSVEYHGLKLMLVGYGGKGKTSLLRALMRERSTKESRYNTATVGINVNLWKYPCRHNGKAVEYQLSCWDFAGQEEFYSTHQCFLSQRALYMVIYDLRKKEEELKCLEPWLLNIKAQAPKCPVLVVGTHLDSIPDRERKSLISDLRQRIATMCCSANFPKITDFAEVDARKDNYTVEELRVRLVRVLEQFTISGEPVMGQKIPASYVRLEELIRGVATSLPPERPILQHKQILKLVKDARLDLDESELQQAVRFLHDSGVLLHFDDATHGLNDLYFVDPQWLCRMMAQVVTVRDINPFAVNGSMRTADLKLIFTGKRIVEGKRAFVFPPQHIPYYLRLLEKFEVALPESKDNILIPARLPSHKPNLPELQDQEREGGHICRDYAMTFLPTGFWPRLISRLHCLKDRIYIDITGRGRSDPKLKLWNRGFFNWWSPTEYFVIEGWYKTSEHLWIRVPRSRFGTKLLVQLVDCVDVLIEEWFPGLTENDITGTQLLQRSIPCPLCSHTLYLATLSPPPGSSSAKQSLLSQPHAFRLEDIVMESEVEDYTVCPRAIDLHPDQDKISLAILAPDVMLTDLNPEFNLETERLELLQTQEFLLGQGAFGSVYRAMYRDQACAVKVFSSSAVSEIPVYRLLRQEVEILRRLQHPSLIQLLAVNRRLLVLELAPLGSLGPLLTQGRVRQRRLIHRMAIQITEGLQFLHTSSIIYRDIKPENVLVFSLNADRSAINVKLSDYGISRLITPYGFVIQEGTEPFMAPEVIRNQGYGLSADIYSLGILLYAVATNGRHPFDSVIYGRVGKLPQLAEFTETPGAPEVPMLIHADTAPTGHQYTEAILAGRRTDTLTSKGVSAWPDMQSLVERCLVWNPADRPTVDQVLDRLNQVDFLTLRQVLPVTKDASIDCMCVRITEEHHIEICTTCGTDNNLVQVTWNNITTDKSKGLILRDKLVLCTLVLSQHLLLGTQSGRLWVYHFDSDKCIHSAALLRDAVLSLIRYDASKNESYVFAGLANGELAIFERLDLVMNPESVPTYINVGSAPLRSMTAHEGRAYLCCGSIVHTFRKLKDDNCFSIKQLCMIESKVQNKQSQIINCICVRHTSIFLSKWSESRVHHYDTNGEPSGEPLDIQEYISLSVGHHISQEDSRVTCLLVWQGNRYLAVGTGGGFLVIIDMTEKCHLVLARHQGPIRAIDRICVNAKCRPDSATIDRTFRAKSKSKVSNLQEESLTLFNKAIIDKHDYVDRITSCLIVSGMGFQSHKSGSAEDDSDYAYLTIWQDDIIDEFRMMTRDGNNRQQLINGSTEI